MKKILNNIYKNKIFLAFICSMLVMVILLCVYYFIFRPKITLVGEDIIYITINDQYLEPGVKAHNLIKDLTNKVKKIGEVNPNKLGTYLLTYKVSSNLLNAKVRRTVKVIDNIKPEIKFKEDIDFIVCPNKEYEELGYEAIDNVDGDITNKVNIIKEEDKVIYTVKDNSNNETSVIRNLIKDNQKPTITLKGNKTVSLAIGGKYYESGYTASDNCDGDITKDVKVTNNINNKKTGTYYVTYSVSDSSGNTTEITRTVKIISPLIPKGSTIYLTFDDGPSNITPKILDILKEENVKATFFVINTSSTYNYLLKRIVDEGHTIGLHGYTHNYSKTYASVNAYFNDLELIRNKVLNLTGVDSKIIRFPGGSSNNVSKFNPGIMTTLAKEVTNRGYHYFDWNVGSSDTVSSCSSSCIYNNVVKGLTSYHTLVVLMHDFSGNTRTLNALRDIIRYGKNNGYKFDRITMDTPQIKHKINN